MLCGDGTNGHKIVSWPLTAQPQSYQTKIRRQEILWFLRTLSPQRTLQQRLLSWEKYWYCSPAHLNTENPQYHTRSWSAFTLTWAQPFWLLVVVVWEVLLPRLVLQGQLPQERLPEPAYSRPPAPDLSGASLLTRCCVRKEKKQIEWRDVLGAPESS